MGYFIGKGNIYYEGDKAEYEDIEVPRRPSNSYTWVEGKWVEVVESKKIKTE